MVHVRFIHDQETVVTVPVRPDVDRDVYKRQVHTSVLLSLLCGTFLIFFGIILAKPLLTLMGTPDNVLGQAALYMRIYFVGRPATMLYNFGAAILRATGDTQRPLYFLFAAGVINVVLNLIFCLLYTSRCV